MTTTSHKYPDDFEEIIYRSMLSMDNKNGVVNLSDVIKTVGKRVKERIDPEAIYIFVNRMCNEGMVEKVAHNQYKAVQFDPNFSLN